MQKSEFLKFSSGPRGSSRFLTCQVCCLLSSSRTEKIKEHLSGTGDRPVDPVPPLSPHLVYSLQGQSPPGSPGDDVIRRMIHRRKVSEEINVTLFIIIYFISSSSEEELLSDWPTEMRI